MTHDKFYPWAKRDDFMLHLIFHEKFPAFVLQLYADVGIPSQDIPRSRLKN